MNAPCCSPGLLPAYAAASPQGPAQECVAVGTQHCFSGRRAENKRRMKQKDSAKVYCYLPGFATFICSTKFSKQKFSATL